VVRSGRNPVHGARQHGFRLDAFHVAIGEVVAPAILSPVSFRAKSPAA
jgi:hypothetical protein